MYNEYGHIRHTVYSCKCLLYEIDVTLILRFLHIDKSWNTWHGGDLRLVDRRLCVMGNIDNMYNIHVIYIICYI